MSQGTDPIPVDSKFSIKLSGSLGRKTVVIEPGVSEETYPDDSLVTLDEDGRPPGDEFVDVDEVLNTFDAPARAGTKSLLEAYGLGLAGRGDDLSIVIARLPALLRDLEPVMRTLGDSETDLAGFIAAMDGFWGELAPVSDELAALTVDLDTTFGALASVATPFIQETIVQTPETLEVATASLKRTRPFLRASTTLFAELEPATAKLETASPVLADAFAAGARNLPLVPELSDRLIVGLDDLASFSDADPVRPGVQRVTATADALAPFVNFLAPAETRCVYLSLLIRNLASTFKEDTANGTAARVSAVVHGVDTNSERGPSNSIYPEPPSKALGPLHSNPYPNTMAPGQPDECEAGNEPYVTNRPVIGNVPGVQDSETEDTEPAVRRLERSRIPLIGWALIGLAAFVLLLAVVFIGPRPVQSAPFELKAAFRSESELQLDSPVRIAGVDVGQVTGIEPLGDDTGAAVVTMRIDDHGLPIRADATATIRSRLLLEGNFYVELQPR